MKKTYNNCKEVLTEEVKEILNDAFSLSLFTKLIEEVNDPYLKKYLGDYILIFSSIFTEEILSAGYANRVSKSFERLIKSLRMNSLKFCPKPDSKRMKEKSEGMGIDFEHYIFDNTIIVDEDNKLYDIGFRTWEYSNLGQEKYNKLNQIAITAFLWNEKLLESNIARLKEVENLLLQILKKKIETKKFRQEWYSTSYLLPTNIKNEEKLYIAQRYGLAKSIEFVREITKDLPKMDIGILELDVQKYIRKTHAILFTIIWDDYNMTNFSLLKNIFKRNTMISEDFYSVNYQIRNNLHYNLTTILKEQEIQIFDENSQYYLKNILDVFEENICVKFGLWYKITNYFAKRQYHKEENANTE